MSKARHPAAAWAKLNLRHLREETHFEPAFEQDLFFFGGEAVRCYWLALKMNRIVAGLISPLFFGKIQVFLLRQHLAALSSDNFT